MKMISRRDFLKASAVVGATAAMTACGGSSSSTAASTASSATASSTAASAAAGSALHSESAVKVFVASTNLPFTRFPVWCTLNGI